MAAERRSNDALSGLPAREHDEELTPMQFRRMLAIEQRRCERSGRRIVLMLVECVDCLGDAQRREISARALRGIAENIRDTDLTGWREENVPGVIFTELGDAESDVIQRALTERLAGVLGRVVGEGIARELRLTFHVWPTGSPADREDSGNGNSLDVAIRPGLARTMKRAIDVGGSLCMILVGSPLLLAIAAAVKLTSHGPVLFRQTRIGQNEQPFTFLKFRSMQDGNDSKIHQEFVTKLIKGELGADTKEFKIVADPRVTPVGRFLRKTSLDELPQLFNVLAGDMSLVGPRPPLPYEFECYKMWHRRRLANVRPGMTGLWQVKGRSRVGFDEMVRLDLRYARSWSLWLDLSILLATPRAVVSGNGAR